jgi:hypothetical protein
VRGRRAAAKLARLKTVVLRRERWREELDSIRRMHARVLEAEAILSGRWASPDEAVTNAGVAARFDAWVAGLRQAVGREDLTDTERRCLQHFLDVTTNLRPQLIQCDDLAGLPRTNNDREGFIRGIKTRYRRLSGRKNWNRYVLRYGRRVAFYEAQLRMEGGREGIEEGIRRVAPGQWRAARAEQRARQEDQLKQYRFRHKRAQFLRGLEARWAEAAHGTSLLP